MTTGGGSTWDPTAPGVLRLPSGRLVRGRGLSREQGSITRCEPSPLWADLLLQDGELMPERQDLRVLFPIAHWQ